MKSYIFPFISIFYDFSDYNFSKHFSFVILLKIYNYAKCTNDEHNHHNHYTSYDKRDKYDHILYHYIHTVEMKNSKLLSMITKKKSCFRKKKIFFFTFGL